MRLYGILYTNDYGDQEICKISLNPIEEEDCWFLDLNEYEAYDMFESCSDDFKWRPCNGLYEKQGVYGNVETNTIYYYDDDDENAIEGCLCQKYINCKPEGEPYFEAYESC